MCTSLRYCIPTPQITDSEILVRVRAAALNPVDYKHIDSAEVVELVAGLEHSCSILQVSVNQGFVFIVAPLWLLLPRQVSGLSSVSAGKIDSLHEKR